MVPGSPRQRAQRADARRNIEAILQAATTCLSLDPEVGMAQIAASAGVGRMTLYGHFPSRSELVDAVLRRTVEESDEVLRSTDTSGDPVTAMTSLVAASWEIVHRFGNILVAAQRELPSEQIHGVHDRILRRIQTLVERGQRSGAFRTDLPKPWLTSLGMRLMHAAAEDVIAGRMTADAVPEVVSGTLLAALAARKPAEQRTDRSAR